MRALADGGSLGVVLGEETATIAEGWPTDPLGWLMALSSRLVREGLRKGFVEAGYDIGAEQWSILAQLWERNGQPQQVLADRFHRSKVAAFHLISRLETQGLVERRPNPDDGRSKLVYLTLEGTAMMGKLIPLAQATLDRGLRDISDPDVETTRSVLLRITSNLAG